MGPEGQTLSMDFDFPDFDYGDEDYKYELKYADYNSDERNEEGTKGQNGIACHVCGDVATGRHYGAVTCNGCKGFFRRTIRRGYKYTCRFNGSCNIDRLNRAVCRFCRYTRCINAGMKEDAVQSERDVIGKRSTAMSNGNQNGSAIPSIPSTSYAVPPTPMPAKRRQSLESSEECIPKRGSPPQGRVSESEVFIPPNLTPPNPPTDPWDTAQGLLDSLLRSENSIQTLRETIVKETGNVEYSMRPEEPKEIANEGRTATVNDIFTSIHSQLLLVIEWAKTLPPFARLATEDQTALLRHFASQQLVLCVAYRSINAANTLKLINNSYIPRVSKKGEEIEFYARDCERVLDELVAPMRFLKIDDTEFAAMKACILFNPVARGLSSSTVMTVLATRRKVFSALELHCKRNRPDDPNRLGDLTFFILSPLQSLANSVSDDVLVSKLSGAARIDLLMEELILNDTEDEHQKKYMIRGRSVSTTESDSGIPQIQRMDAIAMAMAAAEANPFEPTPSTSRHTSISSVQPRQTTIEEDWRGEEEEYGSTLLPSNTTLSSYILGPYDPYTNTFDESPGIPEEHRSSYFDSPTAWSSPVLSACDPPPYHFGSF